MEWLEESEKSLDSELEIANDPDKIKTQLAQHKVGLQLIKTCCVIVCLKITCKFLLDYVCIHHWRKKTLFNVIPIKLENSCPSHWSSGSIFTLQ